MIARLHSLTWLPALAAALAVAMTRPAGAVQGASVLTLRSTLPRIEGETLSGRGTVLPDAAKGKVGVLVFSFSRAASDPARCWSETFSRIGMADADATSFGILMLSDVPWLLRGLVGAGIKKGIPVVLHDRTVKVFADDDPWRTRLNVQSADDPHLVVGDRAGRVRWLYAGACDTAGEQRLREQLKGLAAEKVYLDTAVASISTRAPSSINPFTTTTDIAGKWRPMTSR